jgi:predicted nuclease of predicted toxin-antitoxin system
MKILIDMNLSPLWVNFFQKNNLYLIHWSKLGRATDLDFTIFEYAQQNNYIVFTNDLDFGAILAATKCKIT